MAYQKLPDSKALNKDLASGKLEKIYLFIGEEEGEKEKCIGRIIHLAVKDNEYSSAKFHAEYNELGAASEFLMSGSMFAETRVCVLFNIDSIKANSSDGVILNDLIRNIPDSNILIMTAGENKVPQVLSKVSEKIKVIQFWKLFESDLRNYVISALKKNSLDINPEAAKILIDLTGREIKKVDEAIFKLVNSGEKTITIDVIRYMIADSRDVSVFEFIDSLFQKSRNAFHDLVRVLEVGNNELMILKLVIRQAELIEKYLHLIGNNTAGTAALQEIGINQRNTDVFLKSVRNFSLSSIRRIFPLIHKADQGLKSFNYSGSITFNPLFDLVSGILLAK